MIALLLLVLLFLLRLRKSSSTTVRAAPQIPARISLSAWAADTVHTRPSEKREGAAGAWPPYAQEPPKNNVPLQSLSLSLSLFSSHAHTPFIRSFTFTRPVGRPCRTKPVRRTGSRDVRGKRQDDVTFDVRPTPSVMHDGARARRWNAAGKKKKKTVSTHVPVIEKEPRPTSPRPATPLRNVANRLRTEQIEERSAASR